MSELLNNNSQLITELFDMIEHMEAKIEELEQNAHTSFMGEVYYTDEELSNLLHVSRRTLADWRQNGKIDYIQFPGKIIYPSSAVQRL